MCILIKEEAKIIQYFVIPRRCRRAARASYELVFGCDRGGGGGGSGTPITKEKNKTRGLDDFVVKKKREGT